ncbi:T9SS type A sorting domain-containing protein [Flavobacterium suncheonense]|uniref:T9SS type A sorting domain-containing protein n=1 Tax=Flavobacterium suncheonense TaxID=350894 RepID=UPI003FA36F1A
MLNTTTFKAIRTMFLICSSLCFTPSISQDVLWEKSYGGKHADYLFDVQPTVDYGFILAGSSVSGKNGNKTEVNQGNLDYWIWKMDEKGDLDWQKSFGGSGSDLLQSIKLTSDAGFILAGSSSSQKGLQKKEDNRGQDDFWVIKLDAKGGEMWQKTIGGSGQDKLKTIIQTRDGGYLLGGSSSSDKSGEKEENGRGNLDYWIVKLDKEGKVKWQKTYGGAQLDLLQSVEQTKDGGYILGGSSNSRASGDKTEHNFGFNDYWIIKTDDKGDIEWQRTFGGDKDDQLASLIQTREGMFVLGGSSNSGATNSKSKGSKGTDFWVLKIDDKGEIIWQETYNYGKTDILTSIMENPDGTLLIAGYAQSEVPGTNKKDKEGINDYIALKVNAKGEEIWTQTVGSAGEDLLKKLVVTRDGGYLLAGTSKGKVSRDKNTNQGSNDFWVVKLKDKDKPEKPKASIEAAPNPAETFTNIIVGFEYDSGTASVYDLSGRQLQQFEIKDRTVPIDLSKYPEGIYIVEIRTNAFTESIKVIKKK